MKFLKDVLISSINNWTTTKNMAKIFRYLISVSIAFAFLKLTGVVNWHWKIVISPLYVSCLLVGFLMLSELTSMLITQLLDEIDGNNQKQNR